MSLRTRLEPAFRRITRRLYQPPMLALAAIVIGVVVAAPHVRRLSRELIRQPLYLVDGADIRISKPHKWVRREFFDEAVAAAGLKQPLSVADPTLVPRLKAGLEGSAWVESVDRMDASLNDGLQIHLTYRQPAMTVQTRNGLFPVDALGIVLPPRDFVAEDASRLPRFVLDLPVSPPTVGSRWRHETVLAAAEVAASLDDILATDSIWLRCELTEIRVSAGDESVFELWANNGSRVVWGRIGDTAQDVEPSSDDKVQKLEQILAERGSLAAPAGPYLIDLRRWDVVTLEPLAVSIR